jgi:hypothetical protein
MSTLKSKTKTKIAQPSKLIRGMSRKEFIAWVRQMEDPEYALVMNQIYLETRGRPMYPKEELEIIEQEVKRRNAHP